MVQVAIIMCIYIYMRLYPVTIQTTVARDGENCIWYHMWSGLTINDHQNFWIQGSWIWASLSPTIPGFLFPPRLLLHIPFTHHLERICCKCASVHNSQKYRINNFTIHLPNESAPSLLTIKSLSRSQQATCRICFFSKGRLFRKRSCSILRT